jgi:DNA-binding MarR family transcriptional regulator
MDEQARQVRHLLFQFYLNECRPPTVMELADQSGLMTSEVQYILDKLEQMHHIVQYKHNGRSPTPIAMAHPFSHL